MPTNSKALLIFTLFTVLWLENKAHRCGFTHEKTQKTMKLGEGKNSTTTATTPATTSKSTAAAPIKINPKCNTGTVPSCQCGPDDLSGFQYYAVPKSGNCTDVFKRLPTTPSDYHFREENCHKAQRTECWTGSTCVSNFMDEWNPQPDPLTPVEFILSQNASEPFCSCYSDNGPVPKSGVCGYACNKMQTVCYDICHCNADYVDPTKCDPQTCNNVTAEPFCMCGIDGDHYQMPESGDCMDVIKHFSTTPPYNDRFGFSCYKGRTVCKCTSMPGTQCECKDECVVHPDQCPTLVRL